MALPDRLEAASVAEGRGSPATVEPSELEQVLARGRWHGALYMLGPAFVAAVAYVDPGNFATDLQSGSRFGFLLLWVVVLANGMAMLVQYLSAKLGVVTDRDLAGLVGERALAWLSWLMWVQAEVVCMATDVAEFLGAAVGLNLLFAVPLLPAALITALIAFAVLELRRHGVRAFELAVTAMLGIVLLGFLYETLRIGPSVPGVAGGLVPHLRGPSSLYLAVGIIGATVMPHNLYLHSSIVQTRAYQRSDAGRRDAIKWATTDSTIALMLALFINGAILVVAAATFHKSGHADVAEIGRAFELLSPLLGLGIASTLFAVALLASGLNSTVTATLAGQVVMEGFLHLRLPSWARRLLTRGIAIVPVIVVAALYGEHATGQLLVFSQVVLSMQLPFAVIPLVRFVSDRRKMGDFAISRPVAAAAWIVAGTIVILNVKLLFDTLFG